MDYRKFNNKYVIRLDKGEEIVESIDLIVKNENIKLGTITGIGAVNKAKIGYFEIETKEYHTTDLEEDMEIVSLSGNISEMNGEAYIHMHIALSNNTYLVKGGHLNSATISATGEIAIDSFEGLVDREFNDKVGLNLLSFNS